jgi:hypothetical protein
MLKFADFVKFLNETEPKLEYSKELELFCGGAFGHIEHPFEDVGLTFFDLKEMIRLTVEGGFTPDNFTQFKTDGQQLSISWKDGTLIAARNKTHLKNRGEQALTRDGIAQLFAGRGDIEIAFTAAMDDLTEAIGSLSDSDKEKYFANGAKFASLEVITPITQNTVPYGQNMLVFHGVLEYDEAGNPIGEDKQAGRDLGKLIKDANAAYQKTFFVRGPDDVEIKPLPNANSRYKYYMKRLSSLMDESGCNDSSTVGDYALGMGRNVISKAASDDGITLPESSIDGLARRIADIDKSYGIVQIKKDLGSNASWFINGEKKNAKTWKRDVYGPLESIFLEVGTEIMRTLSSSLVANPTEAAIAMKQEIDDTIEKIRTNGDETDVEKLEAQLKRLSSVGGLEDMVPSEGITFIYKGKLYKYTGLFMICHQIRSILAFKK